MVVIVALCKSRIDSEDFETFFRKPILEGISVQQINRTLERTKWFSWVSTVEEVYQPLVLKNPSPSLRRHFANYGKIFHVAQ
jgi:hypothetical protein